MTSTGLFIPPDDYQGFWAVAGGKGGTVKTTSALHCAMVLARTGKTVVYDCDPRSQSATLWLNGYLATQPPGTRAPFQVIQYTATKGLVEHARNYVLDNDILHVLFDVGGDTENLFRQALRAIATLKEKPGKKARRELLIPISPSAIETVTLNASLAAAEDVAGSEDVEIGASVLWCKVDSRTTELDEARDTAREDDNDWPDLETFVPSQVRYRKAFGQMLTNTGAYENTVREMVIGAAEQQAVTA